MELILKYPKLGLEQLVRPQSLSRKDWIIAKGLECKMTSISIKIV